MCQFQLEVRNISTLRSPSTANPFQVSQQRLYVAQISIAKCITKPKKIQYKKYTTSHLDSFQTPVAQAGRVDSLTLLQPLIYADKSCGPDDIEEVESIWYAGLLSEAHLSTGALCNLC